MSLTLRRLAARYLDLGGQLLVVLVVAGLGAMLALNGASVALRSLGFRSIHWAHEISLVIAIGIYFLGYGLIVRRRAEIRVQFAILGLPTRARRVLDVLGDAAQFALYVTFGILVWQYAMRMRVLPMPITGFSEALVYVPVAIGFFDAAVVVVLRALTGADAQEAAPPPAATG
jgi:TRAP-type C4-dicarboxylate transport system permease small subunit